MKEVNRPSKNTLTAMTRAVCYKYDVIAYQEPYFRDMNVPNPILQKIYARSWSIFCGTGKSSWINTRWWWLPTKRKPDPSYSIHHPRDVARKVFLVERLALVVKLFSCGHRKLQLRVSTGRHENQGWHQGDAHVFHLLFEFFQLGALQQQLSPPPRILRHVTCIGVLRNIHVVNPQLPLIKSTVGLRDARLSRTNRLISEPDNTSPAVNSSASTCKTPSCF